MIPDSGCISDTPQTPKKHNAVESIVKDLNKQTHEFKLEHGYTVEELKRLYSESTPTVELKHVMKTVIKAAKKGRSSVTYKRELDQKQRNRLSVLGYSVEHMSNGHYVITGW